MNNINKDNEGTPFLTFQPIRSVIEKVLEVQKVSSSFPRFPELNAVCNEVIDPKLIVLASPPSLGKTSLALAMMCHIAVKKNIPCGLFSLEMDACHIGLRLLSIETKENLSKAPIVIVDTPMMSIEELNCAIQYMVHNNSVKVVFIDYLGLIQGSTYFQNRYEHQLEIISTLKNMVDEFGISIIVNVQLHRDKSDTTRQSHFDNIAEQADTLLLLDRDTETNEPMVKIVRKSV